MEWLGVAGLIAVGAFLGGSVTYLRLLPLIRERDDTIRARDNTIFLIKNDTDLLVSENRRLRRALMETVPQDMNGGTN